MRERRGRAAPSESAPCSAYGLACAVAVACGCGGAVDGGPRPVEGTWYDSTRWLYHGIPVTVRFTPLDDGLAERVWNYLNGVDATFNAYRESSEVGRINARDGTTAVTVSDDLAAALRLAATLHGLTDGAFDVTVRPVVALWRDAAARGEGPSDESISAARQACGMGRLTLEGNTLRVRSPGVAFDLGGVVKGMAVDKAMQMLEEAGVRAALVQVGGETSAFGMSRRGRRHVVGVQHPTRLRRIWTALADQGEGLSVSTSGNYQQPVVVGTTVYYHIVDARTGRPADTRTRSVTVAFRGTGKNGMADGLTTAGVVLGPERTLALVGRLGGEALFLLDDGGRLVERKTAGWDALVFASAAEGDG